MEIGIYHHRIARHVQSEIGAIKVQFVDVYLPNVFLFSGVFRHCIVKGDVKKAPLHVGIVEQRRRIFKVYAVRNNVQPFQVAPYLQVADIVHGVCLQPLEGELVYLYPTFK